MPKRNALRSRGGGPLDQAAAHSIGMRQSCEDAVNLRRSGRGFRLERGQADGAIGRRTDAAAPPPAGGAVTCAGSAVRSVAPSDARILPTVAGARPS